MRQTFFGLILSFFTGLPLGVELFVFWKICDWLLSWVTFMEGTVPSCSGTTGSPVVALLLCCPDSTPLSSVSFNFSYKRSTKSFFPEESKSASEIAFAANWLSSLCAAVTESILVSSPVPAGAVSRSIIPASTKAFCWSGENISLSFFSSSFGLSPFHSFVKKTGFFDLRR